MLFSAQSGNQFLFFGILRRLQAVCTCQLLQLSDIHIFQGRRHDIRVFHAARRFVRRFFIRKHFVGRRFVRRFFIRKLVSIFIQGQSFSWIIKRFKMLRHILTQLHHFALFPKSALPIAGADYFVSHTGTWISRDRYAQILPPAGAVVSPVIFTRT